MPTSELTEQHHARLIAAGADPDVLASLDLRLHTDEVFNAWTAEGNALYLAAGIEPPPAQLVEQLVEAEAASALVVIGSPMDHLAGLRVDGDGATIFVGPDSDITAGSLYCGGGSSIVFNGAVIATWCAVVDARNGGSIVTEADQLWATNVYIATDDMHRLEDLETGARINPFGAHIKLGRHVWIGRDSTVTGHVEIGDGAVVGMQSMVRGQKIPPNTAVGGVPARVIREGVTWNVEDLP